MDLAPLHLAAGINKIPRNDYGIAGNRSKYHVRKWGIYTLHSAALSNKNPEIIKTLADSGAYLSCSGLV